MILAQGSEVLHHVTPVSSQELRITMVIAYGPANAYQPPKSILSTIWQVRKNIDAISLKRDMIGSQLQADSVHRLGEFEYFREKAWQCSHALQGYVHDIKYT
jgi:hypothetical protein